MRRLTVADLVIRLSGAGPGEEPESGGYGAGMGGTWRARLTGVDQWAEQADQKLR